MPEQDPQNPAPDESAPQTDSDADPAAQPAADNAADNDPPASADASVNEALSDAEQSLQQLQQAVDDSADVSSLQPRDIELLGDVNLNVTIELGRTEMLVEDVLKVAPGSVVELDKLAGDPVDVKVNGRLVARGEVLVLNDNFCIRISEIVADLHEEAQAAVDSEPARPVGAASNPDAENDDDAETQEQDD